MENTPMTPYQRNRRAGRMSAPAVPDAQHTPAVPAVDAAPAQEAPDVHEAPAVQAAPPPPSVAAAPASSQMAPASPKPSPTTPAPQQARRAAPSPKAISAGPGWNMPTAPRPQQRPQQTPLHSGDAKYPVSPARPQQARQQSSLYGTGKYPVSARTPAQRRPASQGTQRPGSAAYPPQYRPQDHTEAEESPVKVPTWLLTALAVLLIGVMGLMTWNIWMEKELNENARAREKAYQDILYEYHLTETEDGRLRVTYQDLIEKYAAEYNLQPAFVTAIIRCESSFNTRAESSVGARGLMQMMPDTAEWVGGKLRDDFDYERLWQAEDNIRYGCWYLNYLSELFRGDPVMIAAAYHAGQGEVWSWLGNPDYSPDGVTLQLESFPEGNTKTYVGRVTKAYGIYQALLYPQDAVPAADGSVVDGSVSDQR